ncbi:MAG: response regulator [Archangium sp.]|nr:response regulator [Archangium sp.]
MPRVMTVDDSRAVRSIIAKQLASLHCEVDEAEDGQQALDKLQDISVDLILLDVTMPVMDGPTMLAKLREQGNHTPVVMLTSESKRSIVAEAMRQGIDDYILKPFKPEELVDKVRRALKLGSEGVPAPERRESVVSSVPGAATASSEGKQFIDVMVIDDMENVGKRVRSLLPPHVTMHSVTSAQAGVAACRERVCRVILIDYDLPDVNSGQLADQLRVIEPHAVFIALALKAQNAKAFIEEARGKGFIDVLFKPISPESVEDFMLQYFDKQDLLVRVENVLTISGYTGRADRAERHFKRLEGLFGAELETIASACFEDVVVDLSKVTTNIDRLPRLLAAVNERAGDVGLKVKLLGNAELKKMLGGYEETKGMEFSADLSEAAAAA